VLEGYAPAAERPPLASYAAMMGVFNGGFAAALTLARRRGHGLQSANEELTSANEELEAMNDE
jgi:hypothetical protein